MDFVREAEKLMAAKTKTSSGERGIHPSHSTWQQRYGKDPDALEERTAIARWLEGFTSRVSDCAE